MASSTPPPPQLLAALQELHSDSSTQSQRFHAQQLCEQFKAQSPPSILLSTATSLFSYPPLPPLSSDLLQHFALHLLEHLITSHWPSLPPSDQSSLQSYLLQILYSLASSPSPPSHLITQKSVSLASNLILRTWPQHWLDLLPSLTPLSRSSTGSLLLCLIYSSIAEEVTLSGTIPESRRKDVQAALLLHLDLVFPFLLSSLQQAGKVREAALTALKAFVEWIPGRWLYETELIPTLLTLLQQEAISKAFTPLMDLLKAITARKTGGLDTSNRLQGVWAVVLQTIDSLLAAPTFPHHHSYLMRSLSVLSHLTRLHSGLLMEPPSGLLQRFLSSLGSLLSHSHPSIAVEALELWVFIFRHQPSLLPQAFRPSLISELFKVACVKVMKQQVSDIPHTDDELEEADYLHLFASFRGTVTALISHMVEAEPAVCFTLCLRRYEAIVASESDDHLNAAGYVTTSSRKFKEMESMSVMLDAMFRALPPASFAAPSPLRETAKALLSLFLSYQTTDPLLQTRRLQALCLFTPVYLSAPSTLHPVLSCLLSSILFRSGRERDVDLTELSEDTRACRRRAVHSLTHIARKCSAQMVSSLGEMTGGVQKMVGEGGVREEEVVLLMEFLVTVSTAGGRGEQEAFVRQMIGGQVEKWGSEAMQEALRGGRGWEEVMGAGKDEVDAVKGVEGGEDVVVVRRRVKAAIAQTHGRRMREEILSSLSTFAAVFKGVLKGGEEGGKAREESAHPSAPLLFSLLPSFFSLLSSIYALRSPSAFPFLPPTMRSVIASSVDHLCLLRSSSPLLSTSEHLHSVILHHFLDQATDSLLLLLSLAARFPSLSTSPLPSSLLSHIPYLHPRQLRYLLDRFFSPLLLDGGSTWQGVGQLCEAAVNRLQIAWQDRGRGTGGGSEAVEIWEENELRECTRCFADCFSRIVHQFDLHTDKQHAVKDASNHLPLSHCPFFVFLFSSLPLASAFLSALHFLLLAPDSQSQSKAARMALRVIPLAAPHSELHPILSSLFSSSLSHLSSLHYSADALTTVDTDLVALVTAIYQQVGKGSAELKRIVAGWTSDEVGWRVVREMEQKMWSEMMSEKKYRAMMKGWLVHCVLGREGGRKEMKVRELETKWDRDIGRKQRENEMRGPLVEGGELQSLFEVQH